MNAEAKPTAGEAATSSEDKFFGIKTTIGGSSEGDEQGDKPIIEVVEEAGGDKKPVVKPKENPVNKGAPDEEVEGYGGKVQKRIDTLTWRAKEAERLQKAAAADRDEAVRVAQTLYHQNQHQANTLASGEATLVEQIRGRAELAVEAASEKYRKAYEAGKTDEIIEAQNELIQAQAENKEAQQYHAEYQNRQQWSNSSHRNSSRFSRQNLRPLNPDHGLRGTRGSGQTSTGT
jgi:hypothetical protein